MIDSSDFLVNPLRFLPNERIAKKISEYADSKTKREFSMVDSCTHAAVLDVVRSIRVFPSPPLYQSDPSDIPEDIFVRVICRYPTLERITFGPPKNFRSSAEFGARETPYFESLISYLENNPEKHPLSSLKKIEYEEIATARSDDDEGTQAKKLNNRFLTAIGQYSLEKVKINAFRFQSFLTGAEIQPVLTNSPNLKTFIFDGLKSYQTVYLSFPSQSQLSKVKLLYGRGRGLASTIASLRDCEKLEELVIDCRNDFYYEISTSLLEEHRWNLKRLELKGIEPQNDFRLDALTKKLPKLECLGIRLQNISDDGMELLGKNCPNLKILQFRNKDLTNSGLDRLTIHLPHLEIISFDEAYNITEEGVAAIARNCNNLRFIRVHHYKQIKKTGIDALIKNCPNLRVVGFSYGDPVSLKDMQGMHYIADQMPNLRYIEPYSMRNVPIELIQGFFQRFPHIEKIPNVSSVKKLHNLTI
jgi:hypothetical protein